MSKPASTGAPATPLNGEWQNVRLIASSAFERAMMFYFVDLEQRAKHVVEMMDIISSIREYALRHADLVVLWDRLRQNTKHLDFVLDITSEIYLMSGIPMANLAGTYANAVHAAIPREFREGKYWATAQNATDTAFLESVSEEKHLAEILACNPWALTLLILKQSGVFSVR